MTQSGALFVMPRPRSAWASAGAVWITVAGWAEAARRRFGAAWVVTPDEVVSPETALTFANSTAARDASAKRRSFARRHLPPTAKTAVKDILGFFRARRAREVGDDGPWRSAAIRFVWQHHDLFSSSGLPLARRRGCPFILFVHAPQVWEARQWGVRRPGWGRLLEALGERPQLRAADLVACVSEEVGDQLRRLGVRESRILVCPMAVDAERFSPRVSGAAVRERYGLDEQFVVGWSGSFRKFHALDLALEAFARVLEELPSARLLLVGHGLEWQSTRDLARRLGVDRQVVFPGAVEFAEVPAHIAAMDACLIVSGATQEFHYSPLKLREYMACSRPVIAPRIGELQRDLRDGHDAVLYEPGDAGDLSRAILELATAPEICARIGQAGRRRVQEAGTWDFQLKRLLERLPGATPGRGYE